MFTNMHFETNNVTSSPHGGNNRDDDHQMTSYTVVLHIGKSHVQKSFFLNINKGYSSIKPAEGASKTLMNHEGVTLAK